MRLHYTEAFQCDLCGAQATVRAPNNLASVANLPEPAEWVVNQVHVAAENRPHRPVDVCPQCATLPFGQVVERLRQALGRLRG